MYSPYLCSLVDEVDITNILEYCKTILRESLRSLSLSLLLPNSQRRQLSYLPARERALFRLRRAGEKVRKAGGKEGSADK